MRIEIEKYKKMTFDEIVKEWLIFETEHWRWSLRLMQDTLGAGVLSLKRITDKMSNLTEEEGADLIRIIKVLEKTLSKLFPVERMNYIMKMMQDHQVHFHVIPRYKTEQTFNGIVFPDKGYPKGHVPGEIVGVETLVAIKKYISNNIW